jgi:hypothetical protein
VDVVSRARPCLQGLKGADLRGEHLPGAEYAEHFLKISPKNSDVEILMRSAVRA